MIITTIIIILVIFAIIAFLVANRKSEDAKEIKEEYNIQDGEITYTDLDKPAKALYCKAHNLAGKPDYIVKKDVTYIPIEVKNTVTNLPYKNHILQLATYCLLVERTYNIKVPYGIIVYDNQQFKIDYDNSIKSELRRTIFEMRQNIKNNVVERNHNSERRCVSCSVRENCEHTVR